MSGSYDSIILSIDPQGIIPFNVTCVILYVALKVIKSSKLKTSASTALIKPESWWTTRKNRNIDINWSSEEVWI